jgi:hypothetical protein
MLADAPNASLPPMSNMMRSADRQVHLKIVTMALVASAVVNVIGLTAQLAPAHSTTVVHAARHASGSVSR